MNKEAVIAAEAAHYVPVFSRYPIVLERGEGCTVYDADGKAYIDFLAGIAVNALGHAHPKLVKAIADQAGKLIHCSNLFYTAVQSELVTRLAALSGLERVFLANSGAEANEGAMKLARKWADVKDPGKKRIISAVHSFHGRTLATLTVTGQPKYQAGLSPLPAGFSYVTYGDLAELKAQMGKDVCAVMLEPIQGEGGVHVPEPGYLAAVKALCDEYDALLIFDEIQTGVGRTGKMFAYEHEGIKPDIVTLAKAWRAACRLVRSWRRKRWRNRSTPATTVPRSAAIRWRLRQPMRCWTSSKKKRWWKMRRRWGNILSASCKAWRRNSRP